MLAEEVKPEDTLPAASIYVSRSSQTERYSPRGFHICQEKQSKRKILSQGLQQKQSNRKILSQGLLYMLAEEVKPEVYLTGVPYMLGEVVKPEDTLPGASAEVVKQEDTLPGSSIYVSRSSQTGIYSPMGFHICQQKKSNRNILSHGLPFILAEEVKPDDTRPGTSIYVSRRSQTGRYSPSGFHICQQKKSNRKILSQRLPYIAEVKPENTLRGASTYVTRRSQTGRYSLWGFHICQQKKSNRKIPFKGLLYRRSQTERYSLSGYHIQQKKSNRKILSQGLPYMVAEEVKPEDTLPGASIYVSRRSQTGSASPRGFHICQEKQSNRKILSQGLPYMLAEVVKPEYTPTWASIYFCRRSQTGRYSSSGFHICQEKKSNRKILSQGLQQKQSTRKILSQGLPYMLAEEVKPEDTLTVASIYVSRRCQTGRYSPRGFHICQQKKSNRKFLSQGLPYMLGEVVKPEDTLPGSSIYVSRSIQTGIYSPMGFHLFQQKKSNRMILAQGLPYMLAEEVKPEDTLPAASIYVSRRNQPGR